MYVLKLESFCEIYFLKICFFLGGGGLFVHLRSQSICGEYWCKNLAELEPHIAIKTQAIKRLIRKISKGIYSLCLQRPYLVSVQSQCKK